MRFNVDSNADLQKLFFVLVFLLFFQIGNVFAHENIGKMQNRFSHISPGDEIGLSPFWDWYTLESDHFRVTFPLELKKQAELSTQYLEEAHSVLSKSLIWDPKNKTQILIIDNSDMANGFTSPELRTGIVFYLAPPDNWFSTAYYDDWLRLLAIHEYTHFLNMDPTRGFFWETARIIFGDVLLPNSFWPTWMLEGLAVYMETRLTQSGRGRSPFYEMVLRTAVEEGKLNTTPIDLINGRNPYYPGGETPYLFGYELMNQLAHVSPNYEKNLGEMSYQSSYRVPYFINDNLEKMLGTNWYKLWDLFITETQARMNSELLRIKSQPLTSVKKLTENGYGVLGVAASPDGKWLAYSQDSIDEKGGVYLKNIEENGETDEDQEEESVERIDDKLMGVQLAFTPDSNAIVYSKIERQSQYYLWSDLFVYDLEFGFPQALTHSLRAKDPDLSKDGKWIVFAKNENSSTGIYIAPFIQDDGDYSLGVIRELYQPKDYDVASTPRFSPNGKTVVFSVHRSGESGEDLVQTEVETGKTITLVHDQSLNRFPAFDSYGNLYFVSDRSGVDNIFQYDDNKIPLQKTNLTSGIWLPSFGPKGLYASVFSTEGWNLGQITLNAQSVPTDSVQVHAEGTPTTDENSRFHSQIKDYPFKPYSIFPSIWPRQWSPLFSLNSGGVYLGGEVFGFDAVYKHIYNVNLGMHSKVGKVDWSASYSNRSFGPTLSLLSEYYTRSLSIAQDYSTVSYDRIISHGVFVSYPILWTDSALSLSVSASAEREFKFIPSQNDPIEKYRYVPNADFKLTFYNSKGSRLAITAEKGNNSQLGFRLYNDSGFMTWKGLFSWVQYVSLLPHIVLVPSLKASYVSKNNSDFLASNVVVSGGSTGLHSSFTDVTSVLNSLLSERSLSGSLTSLPIRGYAEKTFYARMASIESLDLRFPLKRIFRGIGTNPMFVEDFFGFAFVEGTTVQSPFYPEYTQIFLSSLGGGARLSTKALIHVPLIFTAEYHYGLQKEFGGKGNFIIGINMNNFEF